MNTLSETRHVYKKHTNSGNMPILEGVLEGGHIMPGNFDLYELLAAVAGDATVGRYHRLQHRLTEPEKHIIWSQVRIRPIR